MDNIPYYTVEEASRWLSCPQPIALETLRQLGKDCSLLSQLRNVAWIIRDVVGREWAFERAYQADIIQAVFELHPDTRYFLPKENIDVK